MKNITLPILIVAIIVAAGAGFFGGMKYQQSQRPNFQALRNGIGRTGAAGQFGGRGGTNGFRPINGDIISADNNSITVKLADGTSRIIILTDKVMINKAETATIADLKVGTKVAVFGQTNSDNTITAQNIQLNPIQRELPSVSPNPSK